MLKILACLARLGVTLSPDKQHAFQLHRAISGMGRLMFNVLPVAFRLLAHLRCLAVKFVEMALTLKLDPRIAPRYLQVRRSLKLASCASIPLIAKR